MVQQQKTLAGDLVPVKRRKSREKKPRNSSGLSDGQLLAQYSRSVWSFQTHPRDANQKEHGATFPQELAERVVWIYAWKDGVVFDPFLGTATTLKAATALGHWSCGFELNPKFFAKYVQPVITQKTFDGSDPLATAWNCDCREMLDYVMPDSIRLTFTSPPYADFIQKSEEDRASRNPDDVFPTIQKYSSVKRYSDDPRDLGNLEYGRYLDSLEEIFATLYVVTQPGGYCIFYVKDGRDCKNSVPYIPVHADVASMGTRAGFKWHDLVTIDQNENRKLMHNGSRDVFYVNQNTSHLVVLRKER